MNIKKRTAFMRNNIAFKVFALTGTILLLFSVITYLIIFTLLPPTYKSYKQHQLEREVDEFIAKSPALSAEDFTKELEGVRQRTNSMIFIVDGEKKSLFPQIQLGSVNAIGTVSQLTPIEAPFTSLTPVTGAKEGPKLTRTVTYQGKTATLTATSTLQPIDEASKVLMLLAPYVGLFIVIAAVGGSFLYTMLITRPIRKITASASRMAELNLDTRIPVHSSDEIGRLAASLNTMAANLQTSIGDLQTANTQLQLEMEREREVENRRRELFAAVSHELKSPLTIMKGQLEGMLYRIGIYADREVYLEKTLQVAEDMETLISDILRVAKSDQLTVMGRDEQVSLHETVEGLLAKYEELGLQRGVTLQADVPADLSIRTDRKLLETALNNVTHNAIIYTNPGEKVVITAAAGTGSAALEILNTGAQIDAGKLDRIFEPFYRLEQSRNRNTGGSGLGLYLTKHILQQLGIGIRARNTAEGVVFSFHFIQTPTASQKALDPTAPLLKASYL
ncbi:HAMP domain-containing sensor histidine kinase [Paenibacillus filicis]|uniref:histidine kinase n=1 Tax=Paenibacillus filicis TaxID=669464 RepID=A0ABU9DJL7_9BACL